MDIKKTSMLTEKVKYLEMMISKLESSMVKKGDKTDPEESTSNQTVKSGVSSHEQVGMPYLKKAIRLLSQDAERLQLDINIMKTNAEQVRPNA